MERKIVRKFNWFWAWNDDREEAWLEEMSRQGLHLSSLGLPCIYYFEPGAPGDYAYRLDFNTSYKDRANYLALFTDAGWEHLGSLGGWEYFRKLRKPGEAMEIYSDNESKIQKYNRLLMYLMILFLPLVVIFTTGRPDGSLMIYQAARLVMFGFIILYLIALLKIWARINRLKKS